MVSAKATVPKHLRDAPFDFGKQGPDGLFKQSVYLSHMKHYLAVNWMSAMHAISTLGLVVAWHFVTYKVAGNEASPHLAIQIALGALWGLLSMRCFMVLHDCGHGSFFRGSDFANTACGYLFSVFANTPTDFGPTHTLHHDNVGDMDNDVYDWAETIFHTVEQFKAMPAWKRAVWRVLRFPPVFFIAAPFGLWWVKFRIPFYTGKRRHGTYRPWNKMVNTAMVLTHYYLAITYGGWAFTRIMFFGGWFGGCLGMMLFHMQHVHNPGYQTHGNWNRLRAAIHGSSYLHVPAWLKVCVWLCGCVAVWL